MPTHNATLRILVVDDNVNMRRFLCSLMDDIATETREAGDGVAAVREYAAWHPDIVLMDIRMPEMDGIEATRWICGGDPDAIVLIVSDYCDAAYRRDARAAGARDYIAKDDLARLPDAVLNAARNAN